MKQITDSTAMIVRHFKVDRTRTPQQMVTALVRGGQVNTEVLLTMPIKGLEEGDLYFFSAKRLIPASELVLEYESRGLIPDHYAQMQVNAEDPSFANKYPNGSQWQNDRGRFCFIAFSHFSDGCNVTVDCNDNEWDAYWWLAGLMILETQKLH